MKLIFSRTFVFAAFLALPFFSAQLYAEGCNNIPDLAHQQHDEATVQRLENAFTNAFLKGDTDFEKCLLLPSYAETSGRGKWRVLSDELETASRNRGKNLSVPEMPKVDVLMHGDTAIAHGVFTATAADGKSQSTRFTDVYVWTDDAWHVLYSQQTPVAAN